jgi:DNA polymerase III, delta subunit
MNLLIHPRTQQQIDNFINSPLHALALSGEPGSGKGTLGAHIISRIIEVDPTLLDKYAYFNKLDGNNKVGIDEIRRLQTFLSLKVPGRQIFKRAVLLENLGALRHEAQNALLKTIEEPPVDTLIIVTYSLPDQVLPTLHSRMQNIKVMPIDLNYAKKELEGEFNNKLITQAYYMSNGLPGIIYSLLAEKTHPLAQAIEEARGILSMSRFERLGYVDKLLKNKDISPATLLDGLYRLMDASYKQSLDKKTPGELRSFAVRLRLIEQATRDLRANVQNKVVFSRLFTEL